MSVSAFAADAEHSIAIRAKSNFLVIASCFEGLTVHTVFLMYSYTVRDISSTVCKVNDLFSYLQIFLQKNAVQGKKNLLDCNMDAFSFFSTVAPLFCNRYVITL